MIAHFLAVLKSPDRPTHLRVAFMDAEEMTWWIDIEEPITPVRLASLFQSMEVLAGDPMLAIQAGIVTQEDYDAALAARDEARKARGVPKPQVH